MVWCMVYNLRVRETPVVDKDKPNFAPNIREAMSGSGRGRAWECERDTYLLIVFRKSG